MKYKHILWDWNGTLLDDMWLCVESLNRILKKRERPPLDEKTYKETFSFPVKKYYETLGFDFSVGVLIQLPHTYISCRYF